MKLIQLDTLTRPSVVPLDVMYKRFPISQRICLNVKWFWFNFCLNLGLKWVSILTQLSIFDAIYPQHLNRVSRHLKRIDKKETEYYMPLFLFKRYK